MPRKFEIFVFLAMVTGLPSIAPANAQDFPDVQMIANRVLFATQDVTVKKRAAETRRIEALNRRGELQNILIQEQADAVQKIAGELQNIRDERDIVELAATFDATVVAGRWPLARSLLADVITVDLMGGSEPRGTAVTADAFIADLSRRTSKVTVPPRSNQHVLFAGNRANLTSDGLPWSREVRQKPAKDQVGKYEHQFVRTATGWRIDGLTFRF